MMAIVADRKARPGRVKQPVPLEGSAGEQDIPGWSGRLMAWLRVAAQLAGIQMLMVAGTMLGLGIAGLGPAMTAGAILLRRLVEGDASDALWRDFWGAYRKEFRRAVIVTAPLILVVVLAWYELLVLLAHGSGTLAAVLTGAVIAVGGYAIACLAYAPHVLRRYGDAPLPALRFVALAPLLSPLTAVGCAVTAVALIAVGLRYPPLLVLAGIAVPLLLTGLLVDRWLDKVDARRA
jgi:uncharacterized membrane protein YesL